MQVDADSCSLSASPPTPVGLAAVPRTARRFVVWLLGTLAFIVLAVALCARPLLNEDRTVPVEQLVNAPEAASAASLMIRHVVHLVAAGGIILAALWAAVSRRRWRLCGLEVAVLLMIGAALLSLPIASDKRLALNSTIDRILPLIAAAALYQLLVRRPTWRRVLLAGLVAAAAANCAKASAKWWEYRQQWNDYQQQKADFWSQRKVGLDDPQVARHEAFLRGRRPISFIQGPNVTGSFLLLGLVGTGAAVLGCGWRRTRARSQEAAAGEPSATESLLASSPPRNTWIAPRWLLIPAAVLLPLALWHLAVLAWIHTAGTMVALLATLAAGAISLRLKDRPRRLAIVLVGGLLLLQITLIALAVSPTEFRRGLMSYRGAGGDIRNLGARLFLYESAIELFLDHPVTGIGPSQFDKRYLPVKPAYVPVQVSHAHNWLLNAAACRGILGVLGVLVAVGGAGWMILRGLARPPNTSRRPAWVAFLPTVLVILACWLVVMTDMPRSLWAKILPLPVAASLVAGMLVSLCRLNGRLGHLVLLAGLVGFVVHCTVEITPSVPDVMWPFWGVVALAMAWNGPARPLSRRPLRRAIVSTVPFLAGAAALAVALLTVQPMRAVAVMHQAQRAVVRNDHESAVTLLRSAAAVDRLDPLPLKAAAFLRYKLAQKEADRAIEHYREYAELSRAATDRNPLDYTYWRSLGLANMFLGAATEDFALVDEAVGNMQRALELNPRWPVGWLELARMAAVQGNQPDRPALLQIAIDAANQALALDDARPREVPPSLKENERAELFAIRRQLDRRLRIAEARAAAAQSAR